MTNESRQYRKRPIVIEAVQWFKNGDHPDDGPPDREGNVVRYFRRPEEEFAGDLLHVACGERWYAHGWIDTLEGGHTVCPGDWIIKGVQDEVYPCKPDIFEATYEPVSGATENVLCEVHVERGHQDEKWGGPSHDDCHAQHDWARFLGERVQALSANVDPTAGRLFIEVAALAVAAVESIDRLGASTHDV